MIRHTIKVVAVLVAGLHLFHTLYALPAAEARKKVVKKVSAPPQRRVRHKRVRTPPQPPASTMALLTRAQNAAPVGVAALRAASITSARVRLPPGVGTLIPVAELQKRYQAAIDRGELPPDKPLQKGLQEDYADAIAAHKAALAKRAEASKAAGASSPAPPPPVNAAVTYQGLMPDYARYVAFLWDKAIGRRNPKAADLDGQEGLIMSLFNYGCRQISRFMPGYARIVQKRVPVFEFDATDWDQEDEELLEPEKKGKGGSKKKVEADPKKQLQTKIVEVCTVTHKQLEETLKKDTDLLVKPHMGKPGDGKEEEDIAPVSGGGKVGSGDFAMLAEVLSKDIKLADGKFLGADRPLDVAEVCGQFGGKPAWEPASPRGGRRAELDFGTLGVEKALVSSPASRRARRAAIASIEAPRSSVRGLAARLANWRKARPAAGGAQALVKGGAVGAAMVDEAVKYGVDTNPKWPGVYYPATAGACPRGGVFGAPNCQLFSFPIQGLRVNPKVKYWVHAKPDWPGVYYPQEGGRCPHGGKVTGGGACQLLELRKYDPAGTPAVLLGAKELDLLLCKTRLERHVRPGQLLRPACGDEAYLEEQTAQYKNALPRSVKQAVLCRPSWDAECNRKYESLGVKVAAQPSRDKKGVLCVVRSGEQGRKIGDVLLHGDLGKFEPQLKGANLNGIVTKLTGFLQKGADLRTFRAAMSQHKDKIQLREQDTGAVTQGDAMAANEVKEQNKSAPKRADRELLRRAVDQWTDGYQYLSMTTHLKSDKKKLFELYDAAEMSELRRFWGSCAEIKAICADPRTTHEMNSCRRCAVEEAEKHCPDGRKTGVDKCDKGIAIPYPFHDFKNPAGERKWLHTSALSSGHTFKSWLLAKAIEMLHDVALVRGHDAKNLGLVKQRIARSLVVEQFIPRSEGGGDSRYANGEGLKLVDALPITAWQRCYLLRPDSVANPKVCKQVEMGRKGDKRDVHDAAKMDWENAPLFRMVWEDPVFQEHATRVRNLWDKICTSTKNGGWQGKKVLITATANIDKKGVWHGTHAGDGRFDNHTFTNCDKDSATGNRRSQTIVLGALKEFEKSSSGGHGDNSAQIGSSVSTAVGPVIGKLLGMLLKAAGMEDMMKMLAKAAGMTPEQSADCEDVEYRTETMRLPQNSTVQHCLTKVFAKNFTNVLESIIVMLGDKLVDWAIGLIKTLLKIPKASLLTAAGSVPFAGGFLATLVEIVWDLVFDFGLKMLLKNLVIAQLPEWLQIRKMATDKIEKFFENPIVSVIVGIVLQLISAAVQYGNKSWLAVGMDTAIGAVQVVMQAMKPPPFFWLRTLAHAKKEMAKNASAGQSIGDQILGLVRGMLEGFKVAIGRKLDGDLLATFEAGVERVKERFGSMAELKDAFTKGPVKFITGVIARDIGPAALALIAAFVKMPEWTKKVLGVLAKGLETLVGPERPKGPELTKTVMGFLADILEKVKEELLGRIPFGDPAVEALIGRLYDGGVEALRDPSELKAMLDKPGAIFAKLVDLGADFFEAKLDALADSDPKLGEAKPALQEGVKALKDIATAIAGGQSFAEIKARVLKAADDIAKALGLSSAGEGLAKLVDLIKKAIVKRAGMWPPLRGLLERLCDEVGALLANPEQLEGILKNAAAARGALFPRLHAIVAPFFDEAIVKRVPAGFGRQVVELLVGKTVGLLADPSALASYAEAAKSGNIKKLLGVALKEGLKAILGKFATGSMGPILEPAIGCLVSLVSGEKCKLF